MASQGQTGSSTEYRPLIDTPQGIPEDANSEGAGNAPREKQWKMNYTEEEQAVLKECERESFFRSALPIGLGAIFGTQYLVSSGKWTGHPKYGAIPKQFIFGAIGYFAGKLMYLPKCQQKVLEQIPNSNLAAIIRKNRGLSEPGNVEGAPQGFGTPATGSQDGYSKIEPKSSSPSGLDDRFRPSLDSDVKAPENRPEEKPKTSYEDLRRRNRQEPYQKPPQDTPAPPPPPSNQKPYYEGNPYFPQNPWPSKDASPESTCPQEPQQKRKRTNMWGDVIDE